MVAARIAHSSLGQPCVFLAGATPILALDMYEHAYAIDYGAKTGAYVAAFMGAVNWTSADARFAKATS